MEAPSKKPITAVVIDPEELALVAALRANDPAAFETVARTHAPAMLAAARRLLGNEHDAQEAVQDALLSAFRRIETFSGRSRLSTWLHRVAINAALMKLRRRRGRDEQSIEHLLPAFLEDGHQAAPAAEWTDPAPRAMERKETRELVRRCVARLPESYRLILQLRDIEDLDTAQAAELLGVAPGVVKTRLHRARQALRALLDPHLREGAA